MGAPPSRPNLQTELGVELQCSRCREFWPADKEFFHFSDGRPHSWCKACFANDPNVVDKVERFKEQKRGGRAPRFASAPALEFTPLLQAMRVGAPAQDGSPTNG